MKRTDKLTNFIAILLFAAFLLYAGIYAIRAMNDTTVTAEAVAAEIRPGGMAVGIVIRSETVLTSSERYLDITARSGTKVAVGAALATAMDSEAALEQATRIHALELEIDRIGAVLEKLDTPEDLTARDEALRSAVAGITASVARQELGSMEGDALHLRSLLFRTDDATVTKSELQSLQQELASLTGAADTGARTLTAERSGIFSTMLDGYEGLTPERLTDLTPSGLEALLSAEPDVPANAYGKLADNLRWYFAAQMSEADAERLRPGRTATLNFGRWYGADIYAKVQSVSAPEDGSVAVVFACTTALADTLAMRLATADVVFEAYSGIRVPAQALQTDPETAETFVWTITAMQLERKPVTVLYQDGDVAVLSRSSAANALREGNTVVVQGENLYEGKVME